MELYINGRRVRVDPSDSVGKGGEADVYRLDQDTVVKVFKQPDHPDVCGNPADQEAARRRLDEHQSKLRAFPALCGSVIAPLHLATDRTGTRVLGYTMRFLKDADVLLRWSERSFRGNDLGNNAVLDLFLGLHGTLRHLHQQKVVVGDFNDLNVLVVGGTAPFVIDADSFQFGGFLCRVFTERFVDPLLCDPKASRPVLHKPHNEMSDWYAFAVMLFRSLLLCDPYGGVFRPAKRARDVLHAARPLHRITVLDPEVKYPKPAVPFDRLPDEILSWFGSVFHKDVRREFPETLLRGCRWTRCTTCSAEHGRATCPVCRNPAPAAVRQVVKVRGKVTSTRIFETSGEILYSCIQEGELRMLYAQGAVCYRENGHALTGLSKDMLGRIRIGGPHLTWVGKDGKVLELLRIKNLQDHDEVHWVDTVRGVPMFDANGQDFFSIQGSKLQRLGRYGPETIGDVLQDQTLFWVGLKFGFGFYRAGSLSVAFVFDCQAKAINDGVQIPAMKGHLVDSTCYFTTNLCWFMSSLREQGKAINRCAVICGDGTLLATAEAEDGDGSWLGSIRGKCAAGKYLFSVTPDGLARLEMSGGAIMKTAEFPDTEPFVHEGCRLHAGTAGLYVVDRQEVRILKIE